jgi:hypothetical protein
LNSGTKSCSYYDGIKYVNIFFNKIVNDIIDVNLQQLYEKYNELKVNMIKEEKEPYEKFMEIYNNKNGKDYDDALKYLIKTVWRAIFRGNNIPRLIKKSTEDRIYCKKKCCRK